MEEYDSNSKPGTQFSQIPVLNTLPAEPEEEFLDVSHSKSNPSPEPTILMQSKREGESLKPVHSKKPKFRENHGINNDSLLVRVLIDTKNAGGLIGRGGATVKSMRAESNADIEIAHPVQGARKRIVTVSGNADKVEHALHLIARKIAKNKKEGIRRNHGEKKQVFSDGELISIALLIPNGQIGGVIGKAGARISATRNDTECGIHISATCLDSSSEKVVTLRGTSKPVYKALVTICSQLMENVHKTAISPYVPKPELMMNNFLFERPMRGGLIPGRSMVDRLMSERSLLGTSMSGRSMVDRSMSERSILGRSMSGRSMVDRSILGRSMSGRLMTERSMPRILMPNILMNEGSMPTRSTAEDQWMQINSRRSMLDRSMADRSIIDRSMRDRLIARREQIPKRVTLQRSDPFERTPMDFGEAIAEQAKSGYGVHPNNRPTPLSKFSLPKFSLPKFSLPKIVISIPNAHIGYIIGRGGSIINSIRQKSQAKIQISDKSGSKERDVTINGPKQANEYALHLINEQLIFRGAITSPLKPKNMTVI